LKILFISDVYYPRINGVSTSIKSFKENLEQLGHDVRLIAPEYSNHLCSEKWIKRVSSFQVPYDPEDRLMNYFELKKLKKWVESEKFDLIHIHTPFMAHYFGLNLRKTLSIPCIETYHTFFEDYLHHYIPWLPEKFGRRFARWVSRRQCNSVDGVVVPSKPMLDVLTQYGIDKPMSVIPTGIDKHFLTKRNSDVFKLNYQLPMDKKILLYVGRVAKEKNIEFLLHVVKNISRECKDILLLITGEGPADKDLDLKIKELGIYEFVKRLPYLDRGNELPQCYSAADVFVFSSKSETQGIVPLEAMAQGTPVVAIAEMGIASVIKNNEGAFATKDNLEEFVSCVKKLISNDKLHASQSKKAYKYVKENWAASVQAEKVVSFYKASIKHNTKNIKLALNN
jgi:1,2-diacylglycerol 3-alpha-glucosyltransferase